MKAAMIGMQKGSMGIATVNPATGEVVKTFEALADAEIDSKVAIACRIFALSSDNF